MWILVKTFYLKLFYLKLVGILAFLTLLIFPKDPFDYI